MSNIDYTLWPNTNGNLGEIKVQIPDGVTVQWPEGDALVGNFVYNNGLLSGFVDTKALVANDSKSTTFPYDYVNIQVDKSLEGVMTFNGGERTKYLTVSYTTSPNTDGGTFDYVFVDFTTADQETINAVRSAYRVVDKKMYDVDGNVIGTWDTSKLEVGGFLDGETGYADGLFLGVDITNLDFRNIALSEWNSDLSSLNNGAVMFMYCENLESFTSDLSSLINGFYMFFNCSNLTTFTGDLSSLTNGLEMFYNCSNLTTFTSDLSSLTDGYGMFHNCSNLTTFSADLSSLTDGTGIFYRCYNLTTFTGDLSSLKNGSEMFNTCSSLTSFNSDLSSLENGHEMFRDCTSLTTFTTDLSSLTDGYYMFYDCLNLTSFTSNLSSLTNGDSMFWICPNLESFNSDLSSLTNGHYMFDRCSKLTSFTSDLRSLTDGRYMFDGCSLDVPSVQNIAETINTVTDSPTLYIGIGRSTATPEDEAAFQTMREKGWNVYVGYSPSTTSEASAVATLDETDETQTIPTVYWAKPVPSDEEHGRYIDSEGNYFNILGGNLIYVNDPDTYGMFLNEEDAAMQMRLTKIEKTQNKTFPLTQNKMLSLLRK